MMRRSKKEKLEAKGWRFGTVQAAAYVELRRRLADSLRRRRQKRNLSQDRPREASPFEPVPRREDGRRRSFRVHRPSGLLASGSRRFESGSRSSHLRRVPAEGKLGRTDGSGGREESQRRCRHLRSSARPY